MSEKLSGKQAFEYAYYNYADMVYRIAVHNSITVQDAQDVTQEVFVKLIDKTRSFTDSEHLKAWLIRVTINFCHNAYKQSVKYTELDHSIPSPQSKDMQIIDYVKALPENYRNAIYLHYYEGYSAAEIAEILKTKQNTVLSWLSRGRAILKESIGGFEDE